MRMPTPACPSVLDYVARWRELVTARAEQGRRLDPQHGRTDHWGGGRAQRFQRSVVAAREGGDPLLELLRPLLGPETTVLDVGAGPGRHVLPLARLVRHVTAIEPSAAMRGLLQENLSREGLTNVTVVADEWPEAGATLAPADIVICSHVVYGVAEIAPFVQALHAAARRRVVLAMRFGQREEALLDLFARIWGEPRCPAPTAVDLFGVLAQLGIFANVQVVPFPRPRAFDHLDDAVTQVKADLLNPSTPEAEGLIRADLATRLVTRAGKLTFDLPPAWAALLHWAPASANLHTH